MHTASVVMTEAVFFVHIKDAEPVFNYYSSSDSSPGISS